MFEQVLVTKQAFLVSILYSRKLNFSKGVNPRLWLKNKNFFQWIFFGKTGHKIVFKELLVRKKANQSIFEFNKIDVK